MHLQIPYPHTAGDRVLNMNVHMIHKTAQALVQLLKFGTDTWPTHRCGREMAKQPRLEVAGR